MNNEATSIVDVDRAVKTLKGLVVMEDLLDEKRLHCLTDL